MLGAIPTFSSQEANALYDFRLLVIAEAIAKRSPLGRCEDLTAILLPECRL